VKRKEALSVQEEFDVTLFGMPWNDIHVERPAINADVCQLDQPVGSVSMKIVPDVTG
jgi:SMODS-associating 4TM effector domain